MLKGVNWVHNTKVRSIGLESSQMDAQYKYRGYFLGKWSFISQTNPWISVFDVVLLKVKWEMWFLQFLNLNLAKNCGFFLAKCMV